MGRKTSITISGAVPVDALRGVAEVVAQTEAQYELKGAFSETNPYGVADITTKEKILTGASPNFIYVFTLTQVMATGTYTFAFKGEYANIEAKKAAEAVSE